MHHSAVILRLGIVLGLLLPLGLPVTGVAPMAFGFMLVAVALMLRKPLLALQCNWVLISYPSVPKTTDTRYLRTRRIYSGCSLVLGAAGVAICWSVIHGIHWQASQPTDSCLGSEIGRVGTVISMPQQFVAADGTIGQRFTAELQRDEANACTFPVRLSMRYYQTHPLVSIGDTVEVLVTLRALSSQLNRGLIPDQAFNAARGLHARGIVKQLRIRVPASKHSVAALRTRLATHIEKIHAASRVKAVMQALLLGMGNEVQTVDWQHFKMLGLAHVMVISGLHIGLVFLIARMLCVSLLRASSLDAVAVNRLGMVLGLVAASIYALIAGLSLPAVRALCMVFMTQIPGLLGWRTRPGWVLAAILILLLGHNPFSALSSSLWLTMGATYAVLTLSEALSDYPWWLRAMTLQLAMSVIMAPMTVFWFGTVSFWGVVGNATAAPLMTLVAVPALLAGGVQDVLIPDAQNSFWSLCAVVLRVTLALMEGLAVAMPSCGFIELAITTYEFLCLCLLIVFLFRVQGVLPRLGGTLIVLFALWAPALRPPAQARLQMLDVGQGTAILFSEGNEHLLYDTGAPFGSDSTQASRVILPKLRQQAVDGLTHLVVSHRDVDHSGGMRSVVTKLKVDSHWGFGGQRCRAGQRLPWSGAAVIDVLNGSGWEVSNSNASSCVLRIRFAAQTILLAGDIPASTERELVRYWGQGVKADVLAVAHHGSKTSSAWSWLKWVRPRWALISAGFDNRFGHPHSGVVNRLLLSGTEILDTRAHGGISIDFDRRGVRYVTKSRGKMTPFWAQLSQLGEPLGKGILDANKEGTP